MTRIKANLWDILFKMWWNDFYFQVLRSADRWSTGTCEDSILKAYIHTIENSQHYIYIEVMRGTHRLVSCLDRADVYAF